MSKQTRNDDVRTFVKGLRLSPGPCWDQKGESGIPNHEIRNTLNILVKGVEGLWRVELTVSLMVTLGLKSWLGLS